MLQRCFSVLVALVFFTRVTHASLSPVGARSAGMAGVSVTNGDLFSCFNNPAGLSLLHGFTAGTFYESRFLIADVGFKAVALAVPGGKIGCLGFSVKEFGNSFMNDRTYGATLSREFGKQVAAGIRMEWQSLQFAGEYGSGKSLSVSAGMIVEIGGHATVGVSISNPGQSAYSGTNEKVPGAFVAGLKWKVSAHASCFAEGEKSPGLPYVIRASVEYKPRERFSLRTGVSNSHLPFSLGTGIFAAGVEIDISTSWHPELGFTPSVSLTWNKGKRGGR